MLQTIFNSLINCAALIRTPLPRRKKWLIFLTYFGLSVKKIFLSDKKTNETFLGYKIEGVPYSVIFFLFSEIFVRNEYFFQSNEESPTIFDCGANCGFSILYFKWLYPNANIVAFEPDPITFTLLQHHIILNKLENVRAYQVALSDFDGEVEFFTDAIGGGSLKMSLTRRSGLNRAVLVSAKKLSTFIRTYENISYLKMDIEGAEHGVIREVANSGLLSIISRMGIEYHHHVSNNRMPDLGRFLHILESSGFDYVIAARHAPGTRIGITQDVFLTLEKSLVTK